MTGGKGSDTFVLGDKTDGVYYLGDGYAKIQDFRLLEGDKLQLTGNIKDYSISSGSSGSWSLRLNYKNDLVAEISLGGISGMSLGLSLNNTSIVSFS